MGVRVMPRCQSRLTRSGAVTLSHRNNRGHLGGRRPGEAGLAEGRPLVLFQVVLEPSGAPPDPGP